MIKYWCTYNGSDGSKLTVGYRSLVGFISDLTEDMLNPQHDTYSYTLREGNGDEFTIINPNSIKQDS